MKRRMGEFFNPPAMAATRERGGQKRVDAGLGHLDPDQPRAQRDDVGVVVLAGEGGGERLGHQRAAHRRVAVDRDRDTDARSAQRDAELGLAMRDRIGQDVAVVGIIDAGFIVGTKVEYLVAVLAQPGGKLALHRDGGVIGDDGDAH